MNEDNETGGAAAQAADTTTTPRESKTATRVVPMQRDAHGNPFWESYITPASYGVRAEAQIPPHMPGVIIFVHGVNSEGEWYDAAERALCDGLNERLGLTETEFKLTTNSYLDSDSNTQEMHERRYDSSKPGRSPVIRFYWGYRDPGEKPGRYRVPLRNLKGTDFWRRDKEDHGPWFWGGGAFQNGTNNLQQMWCGKGFKRKIGPLGIVDLEALNTEPERQLQDAPMRDYYPHAAKRLANLIDRIRNTYPHDTITIMSHSQGTMIAMAATALCETRAPDALFVMNSPFALDDNVMSDYATSGDDRPTAEARVRTFRNIANRIKTDKRELDERLKGLLQVGVDRDGKPWRPDARINDDLTERDNHGRLYVYFSPHDRVMGLTTIQSIGWQGLPDALVAELDGTVYQRMLARLTPCGDEPRKTPFGTLPDMKRGPYAGPANPKEFWDGNRGPFFGISKLWAVPPANQNVHINAEHVPKPLTAEEMKSFDVSVTDTSIEEMGADPDYRYFESIHEPKEYVDRGEDIYNENRRIRTMETLEEARERLKNHKAEPTDHSTLPKHQEFMRRVVAYDLPIGFCESFDDREFWNGLRMEADWTQCTDAYFERGVLLGPEMPSSYIDKETVADAILQAMAEREKRNRS
ncbi:MAG: DUF3274 domain-containing protein [Dyella sp.]|nr:DUF3274 domain-containing protein [Dyella sp.]